MKIKLNLFVTFLAALSIMSGLFAWGDTVPVAEDGTFSLTDDQKTKLRKADETGFSNDDIEKLIEGVNTELKQILKAQATTAEFDAVRDQLAKMSESLGVTAEEVAEAAKANDPDGKAGAYATSAQLTALQKQDRGR